jgi:hypothetical protein
MATAERATAGAPAESAHSAGAEAGPVASVKRRRFSVSEYYRMAEAGNLAREERVELIDGDS